MAGRYPRFIDSSPHPQLQSPSAASVADQFLQYKDSVASYLEEETAANGSYNTAWEEAKLRYEEYYKDELPSNYLKKINEVLPKRLPESLQSDPTQIPAAVILYSEGDSELLAEFTSATKTLFQKSSADENNAGSSWEAYPFKSLYLLLQLAHDFLPSRPAPQPNGSKRIFRGLDTDEPLTVGQKLQLGYFAAFTPVRALALGKKISADEGGDDGEEDEEEVTESDVPEKFTKTLVRLAYSPKVSSLGIRFLSPQPDEEREVMVMPNQAFKVIDIKKRPKKGFRVAIIQAISSE